MIKDPIVITEDSAFFRKGQIIESYEVAQDGVSIEDKFLNESQFIVLKEKLSKDDESKVRELIRQSLKALFWNIYTKNSTILP